MITNSVNTNGITSPYVRTQTSLSGADVNLVLGNILMGNAAGLSYSITREKAPVFALGSPSPQSFSRNKRGIAGSINLTIFDRSGFYDIMSNSAYASKRWDITGGGASYGYDGSEWVNLQSSADNSIKLPGTIDSSDGGLQSANNPVMGTTGGAITGGTGLELRRPNYADQLPPFDISLTGRNEVGTVASMVLYGVEIVNEGTSQGLNDVGFEGNYTYIARDLVGWTPAQENAATTADVANTLPTLREIDLGVGR